MVCSPRAARSPWVDQEVTTFKRLGRSNRIYSVIVDGEPDGSAQACFPPSLRTRVDAEGVSTGEIMEPWAVDVRTFGKRETLLKVAAGLLGVPYDALKRRDRARNIRRSVLIFAAAFALATVYLGTILIRQRSVNRQISLILATEANALAEAALSSTVLTDRTATLDRAMRYAVLAARTGWLHPAAPEAEPALARSAHASRALFELAGHRGRIQDADFDSTAQQLVTASEDSTARVWDLETGRETARLRGHERGVNSARFSSDGERIVTAGNDGSVRVWDSATGQELIRPGDSGSFDTAIFSPDGAKILAISGISGAIYLWDADSGKAITIIAVNKWTHSASLSPDGTMLLAVTEETPCLWDAETGARMFCLSGHERSVIGAVFNPDGTRILTAGIDGTARVWRTSTGEELHRLGGQEVGMASAVFNFDGTRIMTAGVDGAVRIWDALTGIEIAGVQSLEKPIRQARLSADGSQAITLGKLGGVARVWDLASGRPVAALEGHPRGLSLIRVAAIGGRMVSGGMDGTVRVWELGNFHRRTALQILKKPPTAILQDESRLLIFKPRGVEEWQRAGRWQRARTRDFGGLVIGAALTDQGLRVVTTGASNVARLLDGDSGELIAELVGHQESVACASVSPDGRWVATGSHDRSARIWDSATGTERHRLHVGEWLTDTAFSPDGTRLATVAIGGQARLWDPASGRELADLQGHDGHVNSVAFSPNGEQLITTSNDGTVRIWRTHAGTEVSRLATRSASATSSAAFSPDGTRVVTADGLEQSARIWDLVSGLETARLETAGRGLLDNVAFASFTPDGAQLITVSARTMSGGGWVETWDVSWAMGRNDRQHSSLAPLVSAVCDGATGKLRGRLRLLSAEDVAAMPLLRGREGEDVCQSTLSGRDASREGRRSLRPQVAES